MGVHPDRRPVQLVDLGVVEAETAYHYLVPEGRRGPGKLRRVSTTFLDWTVDGTRCGSAFPTRAMRGADSRG